VFEVRVLCRISHCPMSHQGTIPNSKLYAEVSLMGMKKPNVFHEISQNLSVVHFAYVANELPHDLNKR